MFNNYYQGQKDLFLDVVFIENEFIQGCLNRALRQKDKLNFEVAAICLRLTREIVYEFICIDWLIGVNNLICFVIFEIKLDTSFPNVMKL